MLLDVESQPLHCRKCVVGSSCAVRSSEGTEKSPSQVVPQSMPVCDDVTSPAPVRLTVTWTVPVPLRLAASEPPSDDVTVSDAGAAPTIAGANATSIVQIACAARLAPQWLVGVYAAAPLPLIATVGAAIATWPVFWTWNVNDVAGSYVCCAPYAWLSSTMSIAPGARPLPVTVCCACSVPSPTVIVAIAVPGLSGW